MHSLRFASPQGASPCSAHGRLPLPPPEGGTRRDRGRVNPPEGSAGTPVVLARLVPWNGINFGPPLTRKLAHPLPIPFCWLLTGSMWASGYALGEPWHASTAGPSRVTTAEALCLMMTAPAGAVTLRSRLLPPRPSC